MECIKKLCSKHPDEVLIRTDFMWQMILQAMFKLTNEKSLRKKRFCKTFFKEKMIELCKVLLPHVKFDKMISAMEKDRPHTRFKAVKSLISDIFMLKKNDDQLCTSALQIIEKDLIAQYE